MRSSDKLLGHWARQAAARSVAALAIFVLAACGDESSSVTAGTSVAAVPALVTTAATPAPIATSTASTLSSTTSIASSSAAVSTDGISEYRVSPEQANGAASQADGHRHLIMVPASNRLGRLFLFIGGTGSDPEKMQEILKAGGANGFHVISLAYPNDKSVGSLCHSTEALADPDLQCTGNVRHDIVIGDEPEGRSKLIDVPAADAILGRLRDLLKYLDTNRSQEGWHQFMPRGVIDWSKVTVGGHSQGAGHAAYLAKFKAIARVMVISGVYDQDIAGRQRTDQWVTARWLADPSVTPSGCIYGFVHTKEYESDGGFGIVRDSWKALGLDAYGAIAPVDGEVPPYRNSHQLKTSDPTLGINPHVDMIADATMPRDSAGVPLYRPAWVYLAFTTANYDPACG